MDGKDLWRQNSMANPTHWVDHNAVGPLALARMIPGTRPRLAIDNDAGGGILLAEGMPCAAYQYSRRYEAHPRAHCKMRPNGARPRQANQSNHGHFKDVNNIVPKCTTPHKHCRGGAGRSPSGQRTELSDTGRSSSAGRQITRPTLQQ